MADLEYAEINIYDDISGVENDVNKLYDVYIAPIEKIRSYTMPQINTIPTTSGLGKNGYLSQDLKQLEKSTTSPIESRVHAFYRMLGLPVVSQNSGFYNPGFNPDKSSLQSQDIINTSFYNEKKIPTFIYDREKKLEDNSKIFIVSNNLEKIVYCLLSPILSPFAIFNKDAEDHFTIDQQKSEVDDRASSGGVFAIQNENFLDDINKYVNKFKTTFHQLKPFVVDPRIENCVSPIDNKICAPFLKDKNKTEYKKNSNLFRPGIELIIRMRLEDGLVDENFTKNIENILKKNTNQKASSSSNYSDLALLASNLLEAAPIPDVFKDDVKKAVSAATSQQTDIIIKLNKTLKASLIRLAQAQSKLNEVNKKISWLPLPGPNGPGAPGFTLSTSYSNGSSESNDRIIQLKIKKLSLERQINNYVELGDFAAPFSVNNGFSDSLKSVTDELAEEEARRDRYAAEGFEALQIIEIIKGEISGLGLIDILAMYLALWSIDLKYLLNLLDDASVDRLVANNPKYKNNPEVQSRKSTPAESKDVLKALFELEKKVYYVLDFSDKFFDEVRTKARESSNSKAE